MKRIRIFTLALALVLLLVMCLGLLSACNANDTAKQQSDNTANTGNTSDASNTTGNETTPAADSDMDYIHSNKKMVIGYTVYEPMNYTDDAGNFTGFDTEFAIAVCKKLGVEPDFVEINWDTKETELAAKSIDCIWNGMTINPSRAAEMSISYPYAKNAQVIVVKKSSTVTSTADLIGKTVVAEVGSAGEIQLIGSDEDDPEENLAKADYVAMAKQTDCLLEVKSGTAEAAVLDWTLAKTMVGENTNFSDLMMVEDLKLAEEEYGIAFRKGSDVTEIVNGIILELVADGTLHALADKYDLIISPAIDK